VGYLNSLSGIFSAQTANSPRAVGDTIQDLINVEFGKFVQDISVNYEKDFQRRAMADLAFEDIHGFYNLIDVKTHRVDTKFNMPNLVSVERLARFYREESNYFVLLLVAYAIEGNRVVVSRVNFVPIEFLSWDCLTIGALGWGQIQIANSNKVKINKKFSRKWWMLQLCDQLELFYPKEIAKIGERVEYFQKVREFWEGK
jgi:hypothetical protein